MAHSGTILLGKITKIHGFEGAVAVKLQKDFSENIPALESVFLEIEGRPVPFFIDSVEHVNADKAYFTFTDYSSIEKIREFVGCNILIPSKYAGKDQGNGQPDITGFSVITEKGEPIGIITSVIKNLAQWLIEVDTSAGDRILIPLHDDLIIGVDENDKKIAMSIPDGLTGINKS
jgi:16S rRNA processing protein RimM